MTDGPATTAPEDELEEVVEAETRWLSWKEAGASSVRDAAKRLPPPEDFAATDEPEFDDPFASTRSAKEWARDAFVALLDVQFRRPATRTLLPLAYILSVASFGVGLPIAFVVLMWQASVWLGVLALLVAVPLGVTIAAAVRLMLEFADNAALLAGRVEHIGDLADGLFQALSDVAEPVNQLSEDVRAVQFWRFRKKK
ncbi:DUF4282 domain-containing protein [Nocardia camponoti]|uniref:DUF4282 domain-containing protein n=1 Tax=Nocardia camponoti TaxID=1616106 RepID=A0A917QKY7_9NOCA|nr:DUF4282 domain-containing protein [Nocardia camponoti]GGK55704.1 hypothetical protein GCM10011591_29630 [Nocardia camponoti]